MSKILISLLGTGQQAKNIKVKNRYKKTDYIIEGQLYKDKYFVSSAIIEHFSINKIFVVGTKESMWDNIADYFHADEEYIMEIIDKKENKVLNSKDLEKLQKFMDEKLGSIGSKCKIIEEGKDEKELWLIFDEFLDIFDHISKSDDVYFDITHLFRSVSVVSFIMAELLQIDKNTKIAGLFYGMFAEDEPSKIIDMSVFFELLEWSRAINNLKSYGNSILLLQLINKSDLSIELKQGFENFSNALSISDMGALQQSIKQLKGKLILFESTKILQLISRDLKNFISRLSRNEPANFQFELASWYIDNKNYALAYITLSEAIITATCSRYDWDPFDKDMRQKAKDELYKYGKWDSATKDKQKLNKIYNKIRDIRNAIAHKSSAKSSAKDSIANIKQYLRDSKNLLRRV